MLLSCAQSPHIPKVFDVSGKHVFGKYTNGQWKAPTKYAGKYKVYRREMFIGTVTLKPIQNKSPEPCSPDFTYNENFQSIEKIDYIAVEGTWNHLPRIPKRLNTKDSSYRSIVLEWGKKCNLNLKDFEITEVVQVDIDNDQNPEIIIVAKNIEHTFGATENSFSTVLLQKDSKTYPIASFFLDKESAKHCTEETPCYAAIFRLSMCLDINNDGKLEIIVADTVHEGMGKSIYQWQNNKFERILEWGCGL
ncbi:MAG: hypothetical protein RML38_05660 [Bacteroidia bacterium]|nr:hypothetical protein [Bacteroidia bacterium]